MEVLGVVRKQGKGSGWKFWQQPVQAVPEVLSGAASLLGGHCAPWQAQWGRGRQLMGSLHIRGAQRDPSVLAWP